MANYINNFAASTRRILNEGLDEANDFANLAIAGEQLRRACAIGDADVDAAQALQEYDQFLRSYQGSGAEELAKGLLATLADLQSHSQVAPFERNIERGKDMLLEIDELLSVAAAGLRASLVEKSVVESLASSVRVPIRKLASSIPELAQFAEDRELLFGPDPDVPELFAWWESIAENAPTRMALQVTVASSIRRNSIIAEALAKFDAEHTSSAVSSFVEKLKQRFQTITTPFFVQTPSLAPQASFADTQPIPARLREVIPGEDFSVLCDDTHLVFSVETGRTLVAISIALGNEVLKADTIDDTSFRVPLPTKSGAIRVVLQIDGEELTLPEIDVREQS